MGLFLASFNIEGFVHKKLHVATRNFFLSFLDCAKGLDLFVLWTSLWITGLGIEITN